MTPREEIQNKPCPTCYVHVQRECVDHRRRPLKAGHFKANHFCHVDRVRLLHADYVKHTAWPIGRSPNDVIAHEVFK